MRGSAFWSADGTKVYYLNANRDIVCVTLTRSPEPTVVSREIVRRADADPRRIATLAGLLPDGRFIVTYALERRNRYLVELNWRAEFREKVKRN